MGDEKSNNRCFIGISSSEESESYEEISSSVSCDDDVDEANGSGRDHSEDERDVDKLDEEAIYYKVIHLIRGGSDLQELKLSECKVYLRRHRLRLSGTKGECIERMKEHWKLKDGNGEMFYPRSSFKIDCTGDVCKGDVVLFHQKVYQMSGKVTRGRRHRRRTVAGRVVKESYGAAKQQHTFTVEVLWSRGSKKLDPLFPLLVKGRNLYKMKTFRQLWKNEKERSEVLSEKHRRGDAARSIRDTRKTNKSSTYKGNYVLCFFFEIPSQSHHLGSSRTQERVAKKNRLNDHEVLSEGKKQNCSQGSSFSSKQDGGFRGYNTPQTYYNFQSDVFPPESHKFHSHGGFASTSRSSYSHPLPYHSLNPISEWKDHSYGPFYSHPLPYATLNPISERKDHSYGPVYSYSNHGNEAVSFNRFPRSINDRPSFYSTRDEHRWRY